MTSRHGLANIGNTCYLNSAFQALRHTKSFADYFGTDAWRKHRHEDRKGHEMTEQAADMVVALRSPGDKMVMPVKFVKAFIEFAHDVNEDIRYGAQADAAEAIQILLDGLHTQQAREVRMDISGAAITTDQKELIQSLESWATFFRKEYSPLVDAFYGQTQTKVCCTDCKTCSTRYEPWGVLKVEIPGAEKAGSQAPTLQECIASAFGSEMLEGYKCDNCKKEGTSRKATAISRYPRNLILSLKRFTNAGAKVRARIPYDENMIDMSSWASWSSLSGNPKYRVMSTIEHLGSSRGGHYIMRTRDEAEGKWYIYDDGAVSECREGGAAGPDTYVLFLEQHIS
jgi:ubiquitin C-terminal hydrolase